MAKMVKCKTCGADIAKTAKTCPHCGARRRAGIGRGILGTILLIIGIFIIIGALVGNSGSSSSSLSSSGQNAIQEVNNAASRMKLEEAEAPQITTGDFGVKTIRGSYKNISGATITYAQVTFALFDKDGAQIGTAVANINNIAKDAVWKYSATPLTMDEWVSFQFSEIDSW